MNLSFKAIFGVVSCLVLLCIGLTVSLSLFLQRDLMNGDVNAIIYHTVDDMGPVWIYQYSHYRCISFVPPGYEAQTCIDLRKPKHIMFGYQKMILAGLISVPNPQRICIIGMGGGALPSAIADLYPEALIDNIELNPKMSEYAKDFFYFQESKNMTLHIQDGCQYIKDLPDHICYDAIIVDAFNKNYIPEAFLRLDFVNSIYRHLSVKGVALINTFSNAPTHDLETNLYTTVFKNISDLTPLVAGEGNRVIFASKTPDIDLLSVQRQACQLTMPLIPLGLTPEQIVDMMRIST